ANLKGRILGKNITLQTERSVEPAKPFRAAVGYTNVSKVFYRVVRVDDDLMEKLRYDSYDEGMKAILAQRAVVSGASELPLPQDYLEHHAEIKIDAVPKGRYGLLISAREDFSRSENEVIFSEFWSTSLSLVTANSYESDDRSFRVLHAQTGKPLAGVTAQLFRNEYDYTKRRNKKILSERYTTGSDGKFTVSRWRGDRSYSIELSSSDDRFVPADNYYVNNYRANKNDVEKIVLFTDRSIYRPGQTIYFKGILIKANFNSTTNEILPNESLEVIFYDVNYQKVSSVKLKTNEYGTFNGTFIAPSGVLNGQMQIQTSHRGFSGAVSFSVEDYKRPKFQVEFKPVKEGYKLGDKVKVTGFAKSYAGAAIDGAEVKYRVVRNTRYPYWRYWWMPMPQGADREIAHGTLKSDAAGEYEILFIAAPDKSIAADNKPEFTYTVYADVTDVNGETRSSSTSVRVGYIALDAEMSVPDVVNKEKEFTIRIDTKNLNGEFEAAKGTLTVLALPQSGRVFRNRFYASVPDQFTMPKEEFYRTFPHDLYADENIFRSDSLAVANAKGIAFNNAKEASNVKIPVASYASGKYVAVLQTQDRYGKAVRLEKIFTVYGEKDARPASVEPSYFVPLEKSGYEPGETAKVIWGSANSDVQALYELEHRGKVIK
ncbi:MAG: hypothetical protein IAF08_14175, partial [Rhizobacter sp.]|nr:hypothetical protein [Chlorobiales bacterium]